MAEKSSFFNSIQKDRLYKAEDWADYFGTFISNGVFPKPSTGLGITAGTGMQVVLGAGKAWINGYLYSNTGNLMLQLTTAPAALKRIDRVMIRWSRTSRKINACIVSGTEADRPIVPAVTRDADTYELCVAQILISAGVTQITQSMITDLRSSAEVCGLVGWMVDNIDASGLFLQYDALFRAWFAGLQTDLGGDVAGNLLNKINALETDVGKKVQYTLLYTNAAPSNPYPAQTVTLDLSKYKAVMIEYFTNGAQVGDLFRTEVAIGRRTAMQGTLAVWNNLVHGIRFVDTTTSGIAISDGYARSCNMSSIGTVDNQYCVPYRIWGAEGV